MSPSVSVIRIALEFIHLSLSLYPVHLSHEIITLGECFTQHVFVLSQIKQILKVTRLLYLGEKFIRIWKKRVVAVARAYPGVTTTP